MVDIRRKKYEVKKRAQMSKGVWITKTQSLPHQEQIMMRLGAIGKFSLALEKIRNSRSHRKLTFETYFLQKA